MSISANPGVADHLKPLLTWTSGNHHGAACLNIFLPFFSIVKYIFYTKVTLKYKADINQINKGLICSQPTSSTLIFCVHVLAMNKSCGWGKMSMSKKIVKGVWSSNLFLHKCNKLSNNQLPLCFPTSLGWRCAMPFFIGNVCIQGFH